MEEGVGRLVCLTGASGFIASFILKHLLKCNYKVRATVRNLKDTNIISILRSLDPEGKNLEFVELDLTKPSTFQGAVEGCDYVIHTATPINIVLDGSLTFSSVAEAEEHQIRPAVEGTRGIIRASIAAGVKRVVITSSTAAMESRSIPAEVLDESVWSEDSYVQEHMLSHVNGAYRAAKTMQERTAWLEAGEAIELVSINPGFVLGPNWTRRTSYVEQLLSSLNAEGRLMAAKAGPGKVPDLYMTIVDVREVAEAHVKALEAKAEGRYLLLSDVVHLVDVVNEIRSVDERFGSGKVVIDSVNGRPAAKGRAFNNAKVRGLGVSAVHWKEAVHECAKSMAEQGLGLLSERRNM